VESAQPKAGRNSGSTPPGSVTGAVPEELPLSGEELLDAEDQGDREAADEYIAQGVSPDEEAAAMAVSEGPADIQGVPQAGGAPAGPHALEEALRKGDLPSVKVLLERDAGFGDIGPDGALVLAAENGVKMVKFLLNEGADAGAAPDLLHRVISADIEDKNIIKHLVKEGADVEGLDENGHTPLWTAVLVGDVESARVLIDNWAGVNFSTMDVYDGRVKSLVQLALELERYEIAWLLVKGGAEGYEEADLSLWKEKGK